MISSARYLSAFMVCGVLDGTGVVSEGGGVIVTVACGVGPRKGC